MEGKKRKDPLCRKYSVSHNLLSPSHTHRGFFYAGKNHSWTILYFIIASQPACYIWVSYYDWLWKWKSWEYDFLSFNLCVLIQLFKIIRDRAFKQHALGQRQIEEVISTSRCTYSHLLHKWNDSTRTSQSLSILVVKQCCPFSHHSTTICVLTWNQIHMFMLAIHRHANVAWFHM